MKHPLLRRSVLALLLMTPLVGCGERGNGTVATQARPASAFTEVAVHGAMELQLSVGDAYTIQLEGDSNLLPLINTDISDERLDIRVRTTVSPKLPLVAKVTAPSFDYVEGAGATDIHLSGVDSESLKLVLSGAGEMTVAGKATSLDVDVSGAGSIDAQKLVASNVEVDVSGAGSVDLGAPKKLDVDISGAGSVTHDGEPDIEKRISGAGSVRKR